MKQILKKSGDGVQITLALLVYHDTPVSDTLPSPAELFFGRRTNNRLAPAHQATQLTDSQKSQLVEKRAAHLQQPHAHTEYVPNQPIWFTEDNSPEW